MKLPRPTSEDDRLDLKGATRQALKMARATKFAQITRVDAPALSNYGSPSEADKFMPIDVAVDLCRDIGMPIVLEEMARLCGFKLVPLDPEDGAEIDLDDVSRSQKETSEAVTAITDVVRGMPGARRTALKEIDEGITTLYRVRRKVAA